jgi:hypothetical protein
MKERSKGVQKAKVSNELSNPDFVQYKQYLICAKNKNL